MIFFEWESPMDFFFVIGYYVLYIWNSNNYVYEEIVGKMCILSEWDD